MASWYSAAVCSPAARPITTTWLVRSLVGLSSTGFIAASGSTPAATAWTHWAWPISAPSAVTDALSAMFWALNGATRTPRRASSRHSPATTNDLPASLVVPHTTQPDPVTGRRQRHHYCRRPMARAESLVLVNTGHGKGKSSAAFGVMVRGWARGWRVGVVQFVKGGKWKTGERKLADQLGIEWHTLGDGFTWESTDLERTAELGREAWAVAAAKLASGDYDLLILDELTYSMKYGWVAVDDGGRRPSATGRPRPAWWSTGRDAPDELIEVADTVTEMRKVKHAYDAGDLGAEGHRVLSRRPG